ncbi:DUF6268 family outer membrane beta-barrel protein [Actomonas aquatica]|uniref:DUF6268 family outer membrane beta-barrel protein n=1 Tax=Actomonas aquatica TaxID=2866162 RepID=A0ABZ1CCS0_9BACT|nr:DUF6268 family outer membrane beta-barrel protein [Opitutus sp. WL0086]WRQ89472.1 DUF6268 family outer membrane beta-barrel protein [Opitutus sp. WL0086]
MNKPTSLILPLLLAGGALLAQDESARPSPFTFEFDVIHTANLAMDLPSGATEDMRNTQYAFELEYDLVLDEHGRRVLGFGLEVSRDEFGGNSLTGLVPEQFSSIGLEVSYLHVFNERWLSLTALTVSNATAGTDEWDDDGLGVQGLALARYTFSESLNATFGIYVDSLGVGSDKVNPVLGVQWTPSERWRIDMGVPSTGVTYIPNEQFEFGLVGNFRSDVFALDQPYRQPRNWTDGAKVELLDIRLGAQLKWHLTPVARLELEAGSVLYREMEFHYDDLHVDFESDGSGVYGRIKMSFDF